MWVDGRKNKAGYSGYLVTETNPFANKHASKFTNITYIVYS
jgi:hypothetical protein